MSRSRSTCLLAVLCLCVGANGQRNLWKPNQYCLVDDKDPYLFFSAKTSYDAIRGTADIHTTCTPIQFWMISRHGTRYTSDKVLSSMKKVISLKIQILANYETGLPPSDNRICETDLKALSEWKWDETPEGQNYVLAPEGKREMKELAQRYQIKYPRLLSNYSIESFYFRHTDEQRTWASCRSYIEGLFGSIEGVKIENPLEKDDVIRPYNTCSAWISEVENDENFLEKERTIFRSQPEYLELLEDISRRLGLQETLNYTDIDSMYDVCRYYKAWSPKEVSPWCSVFTRRQLILMEYYDDLYLFYKSGYGHSFNPKLGCRPLILMKEFFQRTIENRQAKPKVIALFSHDTMLNMIFTSLGFAKDEELLKGDNYQTLIYDRKFRGSLNSPFAANIAAILHECDDDDHVVQFYLNERPMELQGCPQGVCTWDRLKELLSVTEFCNLDFCNNKENSL